MMYWMKKTTNAISDTGRKESVQVALLQTHGEDGAYLLMLLGSLIGVSSVLVEMSAGFTFYHEMPTSAINYSLIPIKKAFCALHFWNCFAQLK